MNIVFAGTPEFAAVALQGLLDAGISVSLVLTQPDRPAGRGLKLQASAVKQLAQKHGIPVAQPLSLKLDGKYPEAAQATKQLIEAQKADFMVVAAYGLILPQWTLDAPQHGCLNIHASLLPRWRGAAPIHRAIEAGDPETGVTIMQMDAGLDTGAMLLKEAIPIANDDTTQTLHDKLATLGASLIQSALQSYANLKATPQPDAGVTYAAKISKAESAIDWTQDAEVIERKIRALNPAPGCTTELNGEVVKVWRARVIENPPVAARHPPYFVAGEQVDKFAPTAVGEMSQSDKGVARVLELMEIQRPGGKRMSWAHYERGLQK